MASPGNRHCASCIVTLLFPILTLAPIDLDIRKW